MMQRDRRAGLRTSGLLLVFWVLMSVYGSFKFRTYILIAMDVSNWVPYVRTYILIAMDVSN